VVIECIFFLTPVTIGVPTASSLQTDKMDRTWFYIVVPWESRESPLRKYTFGPYRTFEEALEESGRLGPGEIVELSTKDLEEAVEMLSREDK